MENLVTYLWILALVFAVVMIFIGGLRWIANSNKRKERLNIISICALIFFVLVLVFYNWEKISGIFLNSAALNDDITISLVNVFKIAIKVLVIVIIAVFSLILSFMAILLVVYSVKAILHIISAVNKNDVKKLEKDLQADIEKISISLRYPIFLVTIVVGIMALYLAFPLVIGGNLEKENITKKAENTLNLEKTESITKRWIAGITEIGEFCNINNNDANVNSNNDNNSDINSDNNENIHNNNDSDEKKPNFANCLAVYTLIYILILGIVYAAGNILFEIIAERFESKKGFLKEYSNSIGLLTMGISILYLLSSRRIDLSTKEPLKLVGGFLESFILVIFVIALGVLTLEIVRLLMNMKEKMLRKEARYLFVLLVGLCTMLIMRAFLVIYNAISSALGRNDKWLENMEEGIKEVYHHILKKIAEDMKEEVNVDSKVNDEIPYNTFKGKVTKK